MYQLWNGGGVVLLDLTNNHGAVVEGFFWQLSWEEWEKVVKMSDLSPGSVKINQAEFLAALITCETFARFREVHVSHAG